MKKAIIAIVLLAAGVTVGVLVLKQPPVSSVGIAELVPGETLFLAQLPDIAGSRTRLTETALWKIAHDPEVTAFLERPRSLIPKSADREDTAARLDAAQPLRGFLAVTAISDNMPHAVGGIEFGGKKEDAETLITKARIQAQTASPTGKSDLIKYEGFDVETFSDKGVTVAGTFAGKWYLVANDVDLLKATLDRFSGKNKLGSLADAEPYKKSFTHFPKDQDFSFFVQPATLIDKLVTLITAAGQKIDPKSVAEMRKLQAIAGGDKIDGELLRDTLFFLEPGAAKVPTLTGNTLALTSTDTLLYSAFAPNIPDKLDLPDPSAAGSAGIPTNVLGVAQAFLGNLAQQGVQVDDFKKAFGPEMALMLDWPAGSAEPALGIAGQVKDAALAKKFVQAALGTWQREDGDGVTYWNSPPDKTSTSIAQITPTVALTDKNIWIGLSPEEVKAAVARSKAGGATIEKSATYASALSTVSKPGTTLAYVDSKALFEHVYSTLRPMAMMWAGFIPHVADYVDVSKLPTTEAISRHLQPLVLSGSQLDDGFLFESTGPATVYQAATVLGASLGAVAVPVLQGKLAIPGLSLPGMGNPLAPTSSGPVPPPAPMPQMAPATPPASTGTDNNNASATPSPAP